MQLYYQEGHEAELPKIMEALVAVNEFERQHKLTLSEKGFQKYKKLMDAVYEAIPECPFEISCIRKLKDLDKVFSYEPVIFIHDDRANEHNYYYSEMSHEERNQYNHFLKVERMDDKPITMRQVLEAMSNDPHYSDEVVMGDPHMFLEFFELSNNSNIQYTMFWGS